MKRALIGVDGNCGFALLGVDIQSGEAEFVEIDHEAMEGRNRYYDSDWCAAADRAITQALNQLRKRIPGGDDRGNRETWITYALDSSHPRSA